MTKTYFADESYLDVFEERTNEPFISYVHEETILRNIETEISEFCNQMTKNNPVELINKLDRDILAREFIESKSIQHLVPDIVKTAKFHKDVMIEIDYRLVRGFIRNKNPEKQASEFRFWNISGTGLLYRFKVNYKREEYTRKSVISRVKEDVSNGVSEAFKANVSLYEILNNSEQIPNVISVRTEKQVGSEQKKKNTSSQSFVYNKNEVTRQIKERINKPVSHQIHNHLINEFITTDGSDFSNGKHFNDSWIDFLSELLKDEDRYNELKVISKKN